MKNKKIYTSIILILSLIFILCPLPSYSLEKATHRAINQYITENTINGFSLSTFLKNNLGFDKGKDEPIDEQAIYKWFGDGGQKEDEPDGLIRIVLNRGRSNNHFHNPLLTWNTAGLSDTSSYLQKTVMVYGG
jgi:hypothetical protein